MLNYPTIKSTESNLVEPNNIEPNDVVQSVNEIDTNE